MINQRVRLTKDEIVILLEALDQEALCWRKKGAQWWEIEDLIDRLTDAYLGQSPSGFQTP